MKVRFLAYLAIAWFAVVTDGSAQENIIAGTAFRTGSLIDAYPEFLDSTDATTRAWNLGGVDVTYNGVTLFGTLGIGGNIPGTLPGTVGDLTITSGNEGAFSGPNWSSLQSVEQQEITDTQLRRSADFLLDIAAVEGQVYLLEILSASSPFQGDRTMDVTVDGVLVADNLFNSASTPSTFSVVYQYEVTADADGIDLTFGVGDSGTGFNPYVSAISVTEVPALSGLAVVPEPSSLAMLALAGGIGLVRRSRSRKR